MNWISVNDKLPNIGQIVLAYINNKIYMGSFFATEQYQIDSNGLKTNYKKTMTFEPEIWLDKNHCDQCEMPGKKCEDDDQCVDCCEKDYEFQMLIPSFKLKQITHWMPLPEPPKEQK